jgi:glycosyltransferase involved in cell wall biosynthesis
VKVAVAGPYPPFRGGIAQFTSRLADSLEAVCPVSRIGFSRLYPSFLFPGRSQYDPVPSAGAPLEASIDSCSPAAWARTRRAVAALGADHAVVEWWHPFFAPSYQHSLPSPHRLPRAMICHNILPHDRFPMSRAITRAFLSKARLLVVHSGADEDAVHMLLPGARILRLFHPIYDQYVRNSSDLIRARQLFGFTDRDRVVLFFGLIRPYKGLEDLLEAVAGMDGNVKLLVAGEAYSGADAIRRRISAPDLSGRVYWTDRFIPDDEVGGFFRAADVVALPYRNATQSGVAQIALAFRKVLVLTRTGGLSELVEEGSTGTLAEPGDPDDIRRAVAEALELSRDSGVGARIASVASRFSWEAYGSALLEALG